MYKIPVKDDGEIQKTEGQPCAKLHNDALNDTSMYVW